MENLLIEGPYEAAKPPKSLTFSEKFLFFIEILCDALRVFVLSVPIFLKCFFEIFIPRQKKCIAGQVAFVTGGGHGIGRATVLRLAAQGCHIAIVDKDGEAAKKAARDAKIFDIKALGYEIDVTDHEKLVALAEQIENDLGPVDIIVNNAGILPKLSLRNGPADHIKRITDVNINSHFWTVRTFLPGMIKRKRGHIITICSMAFLIPIANAITYTTTKWAVTGFTKALEQEIRQDGLGDYIHFSCVYPYFVATRKELMDSCILRFPAITPVEAADAIVDGMLRNQRDIYIPWLYSLFAKFTNALPFAAQNLMRDCIFKEKDWILIDTRSEVQYSNDNDM